MFSIKNYKHKKNDFWDFDDHCPKAFSDNHTNYLANFQKSSSTVFDKIEEVSHKLDKFCWEHILCIHKYPYYTKLQSNFMHSLLKLLRKVRIYVFCPILCFIAMALVIEVFRWRIMLLWFLEDKSFSKNENLCFIITRLLTTKYYNLVSRFSKPNL